MILEKIKLKIGATRPTKIQYESVRADIELEITLDHTEHIAGELLKPTWKRIRSKAKVMLLEAMADAEKGIGR
jgi:molecular chaperone DnaK (HSP70)